MLKTVLETLDGVDDAIKPFYAEKDGKFFLQVEGINEHPDVVNLKNAYERVKADKTKAIEERDAFKAKAEAVPDDFDPKVWDKAKTGKPDEAEVIKIRQELEGKLAATEQAKAEAEARLHRFAIERDLGDALIAAGINEPAYVRAARALLEGNVKAGEDGKAIVETDMGPMPVTEYVKRWAAGEGKAFVTPPNGGGRSGGEGEGTRKKWSEMTGDEKVALHRENPAEYERLKKEAGANRK
ncbi:hypothetical protein [Oricola thermophila]|uniref:Uncharacterized protein n=1 Tax=Oricola thermophila TaxID=2742145 RepID=A0A6N1VFV2_9HYPH|nr:hypothetical protein [Oricola thermophila]QKV17847.1 hypothetical protein HTY61_04925 [Oricola thermophila]